MGLGLTGVGVQRVLIVLMGLRTELIKRMRSLSNSLLS